MERFKLTNESVRARCLPPAAGERTAGGRDVIQKMYWDADLPGFGVLVGRQAKTFIVQRDVRGKTVRRKIGRYPTWAVEQARKQARETLVMLDRGEDPLAKSRAAAEAERANEWKRYTLAQATDEHVRCMEAKHCTPETIAQLRRELERHAAGWQARPLAGVSRKDAIDLHRAITKDAGPYVANRVVRELRAVYNSARKLFDLLPPHPFVGVTLNKEHRRREPIPFADLPAWAAKVDAMKNGVRRDFNWFVLLTGSRKTAASHLRWEHVDFDRGTVHFPKPKGGVDRAFTIPLCRHLLAVLAERKKANRVLCTTGDKGIVFPAFGNDGQVIPIAETKQAKYVDQPDGTVKKVTQLPSPHRLRDTFTTAANEAGVDFVTIKVLLNHSLPSGDVTMGYMRPSAEHMRAAVEKVAAFLLGKANPAAAVAVQAAQGAA